MTPNIIFLFFIFSNSKKKSYSFRKLYAFKDCKYDFSIILYIHGTCTRMLCKLLRRKCPVGFGSDFWSDPYPVEESTDPVEESTDPVEASPAPIGLSYSTTSKTKAVWTTISED